jgi:hypothetical protein
MGQFIYIYERAFYNGKRIKIRKDLIEKQARHQHLSEAIGKVKLIKKRKS